MKKTYVYEPPFYQIEVTAVGVLCAAVLVACIWMAVANVGIGPELSVVVGIVCFYQVWNTFVSLSNPERVIVDEDADTITFSGYGRENTYVISELKTFLVRPFPSSGKTYVRVNDHSISKGRYWVPTKMFNDSRELFDFLCNLEYRVHPDSIKARARNVNQEYIDHADQIKAIEERQRAEKRQKRRRQRSTHEEGWLSDSTDSATERDGGNEMDVGTEPVTPHEDRSATITHEEE